MFFMTDASATSARLRFQPLSVAHAEALAGLVDPRVRDLLGPAAPKDLPQLIESFAEALAIARACGPDEPFLAYAVHLAATGACVGRIDALVRDGGAEIAVQFVPEAWGRGLAAEAVRWIEARAEGHGARRFWATVGPHNARSRALFARLGYAPVPPWEAPDLASYDPGDLVLGRDAGAPDP
jgi:RimJ/RimL family protein N-acetyltransferase